MSSLGPYLRELRQRRGISLDEAARVTRVAFRYLEALESDDFDRLPAPVFAKGFIRAYCQVLDVAPDEALALFNQQLTGTPAAPSLLAAAADDPPRDERHKRGTVRVSFVLVVVLGGALLAVTLALQSGREGSRPARSASLATLPPEGSAPEPSAGEPPATLPVPEIEPPAPELPRGISSPPPPSAPPRAIASPPAPASPAPAALPSPPPAAPPRPSPPPPLRSAPAEPGVAAAVGPVSLPYRLVARVSEPTWIRVRTGDGRATEETVPAGEVREWVSNAPFILTVGNAGGVTLELNGRALPPLGERGAVIPRLVIPPAEQ